MLKLRNPGWPPEGASGSPVSVLMPGHIAPEDEREQWKQRMKEAARGTEDGAKLRNQVPSVQMWVFKSRDQKANRFHSAKAQ